MELGNAIFGHSRGDYSIPRGCGWEEQLIKLFDVYAADRDNSWREYGIEFENKTFSVFPYYWGECTCGYEQKEYKWNEKNNHEDHCYQTALKTEQNDWLVQNPEPTAELLKVKKKKIEHRITMISISGADKSSQKSEWLKWFHRREKKWEKIYTKLCAEYKLDRKFGCAVHCTCNYTQRWDRFRAENNHDENCPIVKPNFLFKPTGFKIQWYKYPLRDSYMNINIPLGVFRKIIDECIASLK